MESGQNVSGQLCGGVGTSFRLCGQPGLAELKAVISLLPRLTPRQKHTHDQAHSKGWSQAKDSFCASKVRPWCGMEEFGGWAFFISLLSNSEVNLDAGQMTSHLWMTFSAPSVKWGQWIKLSLKLFLVPSCMVLFQKENPPFICSVWNWQRQGMVANPQIGHNS